jgi:hypothetical protein
MNGLALLGEWPTDVHPTKTKLTHATTRRISEGRRCCDIELERNRAVIGSAGKSCPWVLPYSPGDHGPGLNCFSSDAEAPQRPSRRCHRTTITQMFYLHVIRIRERSGARASALPVDFERP